MATSPTTDAPGVEATAVDLETAPPWTAGEAARVVTVTDTPPGAFRVLRDAWRARRLWPSLGNRVLVKFIWGTKLGAWWLVLRPLMDSLGKTLIFGGLLQVSTPGAAPYFIFLIVGLIAWRTFDRLVLYATRSFDFYRKIMREIDFPLLLVPIGSAAFPLIEVAVYSTVFLGTILFFYALQGDFWLQIGYETLVAPVGLGILVTAGLGLGFWTSVLNGKARDTRLVMRYVLEFWLYLTPVVYPLSAVPGTYRWLATANPMTAPVEMVKAGLLGTGNVQLYPLVWSVVFASLLFVSGLWFFSREARASVDIHGPIDDDEEDDERSEV